MKDAMEQWYQEVPSGAAGTPYQVVSNSAATSQDLQSLFSPASAVPRGGCWMTFYNNNATITYLSFAPKGTTAVGTTNTNALDIQPYSRRRLWVLPASLHGSIISTQVLNFHVSSISGAARGSVMQGT